MTAKLLGSDLVQDQRQVPIQVGAEIKTQDGTGTPRESPFNLTTTEVFEIKVPTGGVVLVCRCAAAFRIGDNGVLDGTTDEGFYPVAADTDFRVPCANGDSIFVRNEASATNAFHFFFEMLNP